MAKGSSTSSDLFRIDRPIRSPSTVDPMITPHKKRTRSAVSSPKRFNSDYYLTLASHVVMKPLGMPPGSSNI